MSPGGRALDERSRGSDQQRGDRTIRRLLCVLALGGTAVTAHAYTITLAAAAPKTIYLQIGLGTFTGTYCGNNCSYVEPVTQSPGSAPGKNTTINTVSVSVAANAVGNSVAQAMTTNSTQATSFFDGFAFCNTPTQLYIGGFYRTTGNGTASGTVTATVPAALTDGNGDTLPFSQISWTSTGNGDTGAEPFPAGTFGAGGVQTVGAIAQNQWAESCWTFSYRNSIVPPAGTYTGVVLYTLTAP
jgi:hypothetical protein